MKKEKEIVKATLTYSDGSTKEIKDGYITGIEKSEEDKTAYIALIGSETETRNMLAFVESILVFAVQTGFAEKFEQIHKNQMDGEE